MTKRPSKPRETPAERPRGRVRSVAEMLPDVGGAAFRRFGFVQSSVVSRWAEIVGERYAGVSVPEMIRFPSGKRSGGTLVLSVEGAHAPMMQHVGPVILERVNRFFGYPAVARITIQQGGPAKPRVAPASLKPVGLKPVPLDLVASGLLDGDIGESLRTIADPELRDCLSALAAAVVASEGPPRIGTTRPVRSRD